MSAPKVFISYSWSSPEHQQWVVDLATQLRENGVDAILDKWDLKEGHDSIVFMERMVTDPGVQKVIIVSDRLYAERANDRRGGVGTETQIISPQIYAKADQDKFVAVVSEVDTDGKAFLPAYYGSRIYINLSREDIYPENFEQLVRWIYGKPLFPKPPVGKPPVYIDETTALLPTRSRAARTIDLLQKGSPLAEASLREYLETLSGGFENLRIDMSSEHDPFDDAVVESIEAFLPYRDEFVRVITALARSGVTESQAILLKRFFEIVLTYCYPKRDMQTYSNDWFDNFKFIVHELFLYTAAVLLQYERFSALDHIITGGFYLGSLQEFLNDPVQGLAILDQSVGSLEVRKRRLSLNRVSLHADFLNDRAKIAGVDFEEIMQADFILFMREANDALKRDTHNRWHPDTLVFSGRRFAPYPVFARARSARYFEKIKGLLGVQSVADLNKTIEAFGTKLYLPRWNYHSLRPQEMMGLNEIASTT